VLAFPSAPVLQEQEPKYGMPEDAIAYASTSRLVLTSESVFKTSLMGYPASTPYCHVLLIIIIKLPN
jgi:hypothetical protein